MPWAARLAAVVALPDEELGRPRRPLEPEAARFAGQVLTARQLADRYGVTDTDGSRPDAWGYIATYGMWEQSGQDVERFR